MGIGGSSSSMRRNVQKHYIMLQTSRKQNKFEMDRGEVLGEVLSDRSRIFSEFGPAGYFILRKDL